MELTEEIEELVEAKAETNAVIDKQNRHASELVALKRTRGQEPADAPCPKCLRLQDDLSSLRRQVSLEPRQAASMDRGSFYVEQLASARAAVQDYKEKVAEQASTIRELTFEKKMVQEDSARDILLADTKGRLAVFESCCANNRTYSFPSHS